MCFCKPGWVNRDPGPGTQSPTPSTTPLPVMLPAVCLYRRIELKMYLFPTKNTHVYLFLETPFSHCRAPLAFTSYFHFRFTDPRKNHRFLWTGTTTSWTRAHSHLGAGPRNPSSWPERYTTLSVKRPGNRDTSCDLLIIRQIQHNQPENKDKLDGQRY